MASLSLQLARRFRKSKKQSGFTSFISASSTFGIALGCAVLIIMLSVMNGFERELKQSLLAYIPHGELYAVDNNGLVNWPEIVEAFAADSQVQHVQPYAKVTGLVQKGKHNKAVELTALDGRYANDSALVNKLDKDQWHQFRINQSSLILGSSIIKKLELSIGDRVQVLLPKANSTRISAPESVWLTLVGEIHLGGELDSFIGFMHLSTAAQKLSIGQGAQGVQMTFIDPFMAPQKIRQLGYRLNQHAYISDWTRTRGHLYQDIKLVRFVVYIALTLVIAVACFNIVSSLVMAVNERKPEIAMLKTMGGTSTLIISIFIWQGLINGLVGIAIGSILGVLLATNLTQIAMVLESLFNQKILSGDVYFINFLPSELNSQDVLVTIAIALVLSVVATIYPALKAAKIEPAKVLGH